jgi:hypothetical protein
MKRPAPAHSLRRLWLAGSRTFLDFGMRVMFRKSTVFILGAGASWHYGYPTGEALVDAVISMAGKFSQYCQHRLQSGQVIQHVPDYILQFVESGSGTDGIVAAWQRAAKECKLLIDRLKSVRPILIDHFLAWNQSLRLIGKLLISAVILECEAIWFEQQANQNRRLLLANSPIPPKDDLARVDVTKYRDDWCRFLIHKLVYNCPESNDLLRNDVHFVTFNYDSSLEYRLFSGLSSMDLLQPQHVLEFLTENRIVHVYGSVHSAIPLNYERIDLRSAIDLGKSFEAPLNFPLEFEPRKVFLDRCLTAAQGLRTIDPHDKEEDEKSLAVARKWIAEAKVVYILGYGFDRNNSRRIGLAASANGKSIMFTNFGNSNVVNKSASALWYGDQSAFLSDTDGWVDGSPNGEYYIEKSVRDVYEAFDKDFSPLVDE